MVWLQGVWAGEVVLIQGVQRRLDSGPCLKELRTNCTKCAMARSVNLCYLIQEEPLAWPGDRRADLPTGCSCRDSQWENPKGAEENPLVWLVGEFGGKGWQSSGRERIRRPGGLAEVSLWQIIGSH